MIFGWHCKLRQPKANTASQWKYNPFATKCKKQLVECRIQSCGTF